MGFFVNSPAIYKKNSVSRYLGHILNGHFVR